MECPAPGGVADTDTDADTDGDADTDTDADTDSDTDTGYIDPCAPPYSLGFTGCCKDGVYFYYCDGSTLHSFDCINFFDPPECGWDTGNGWHDCQSTTVDVDPTLPDGGPAGDDCPDGMPPVTDSK